tara:strand:- start:876 stop:1310 length:435 start_codon:yes stop_codon:yes gene_type:complete
MNKNELKKILKPLIKECIKEVIFEDGTLSTIISEVVKGTSQNIVSSKPTANVSQQFSNEAQILRQEEKQKQLKERRKKMLDAIGRDSYNGVDLFEGTTPTAPPRSNSSAPQGSQPLDGVDPRDPGVDISSFGMSSGIWKKLAGN